MKARQIFPAWKMILEGRRPFLSVEITRRCPLHCPGCYAFEPGHTVADGNGESETDFEGEALIEGILALQRKYRPLHISLVGGEPLVRYRELNKLLPLLAPTEVQLVTSAVRPVPREWADYPHVHIAVSVDGLPAEHNRRRAPATYDRILENIAGHRVIIHCTVTRQLVQRPGYLSDFAAFWSERPEARKIWFSLFTPQRGQLSAERLTVADRARAVEELRQLPSRFPKVHLPELVLQGFVQPPGSPDACIFAQVTTCMAADLKSEITPCELGGTPECGECGCLAAAGMTAIGRYRLAGLLPVGSIFDLSRKIAARRRDINLMDAGPQEAD